MKLLSLNTGTFKLDGGAMFGIVPKVLWQKVYPADQNNLVTLSMKTLLIQTDKHLILVDTGIGNKQDQKFYNNFGLTQNHNLAELLQQHGYNPQDVTDIIHTHLHFDHCGWTIGQDPNGNFFNMFPNAKLHVSKEQWQQATNPNPRERASFLKENILPMQQLGNLSLVDQQGELLPNIHVRFANGHTKGQILLFINYNGRWLLHAGDLFPAASLVYEPWIMSYDICALATLDDKKKILDEVFQKNATIFFEHDFYQECSTVVRTQKGTKVDKTFSLADFVAQ